MARASVPSLYDRASHELEAAAVDEQAARKISELDVSPRAPHTTLQRCTERTIWHGQCSSRWPLRQAALTLAHSDLETLRGELQLRQEAEREAGREQAEQKYTAAAAAQHIRALQLDTERLQTELQSVQVMQSPS